MSQFSQVLLGGRELLVVQFSIDVDQVSHSLVSASVPSSTVGGENLVWLKIKH